MVRQGDGGGQPGGTDSRHGDHAGQAVIEPDLIAALRTVAPQPRVDGHRRMVPEARTESRCRAGHLPQAGARGPGGDQGLRGKVLRRRAGKQVAEDRGGHEHALGPLRGNGQQDPPHPRGALLVEDEELSAPRVGVEGTRPVGAGQGHGAEPGRVDHPPSPELPSLPEPKALEVGVPVRRHLADVEPQQDVNAVHEGRLGQGDAGGERVHDALPRDVQAAQHGWGGARLQGAETPGGQDLHVLHAVGRGPGLQVGQRPLLVPVEGEQQCRGPEKGDPEARGDVRPPSRGLVDQTRLQGAGRGVETGVNDGAVGLGCALAHVEPPVEEDDPEPVQREREAQRTPHDARTHHGNIVGLLVARSARNPPGRVAGSLGPGVPNAPPGGLKGHYLIVEGTWHGGCSNGPGCKACEIPRSEAYEPYVATTRNEPNAADGAFSTASYRSVQRALPRQTVLHLP